MKNKTLKKICLMMSVLMGLSMLAGCSDKSADIIDRDTTTSAAETTAASSETETTTTTETTAETTVSETTTTAESTADSTADSTASNTDGNEIIANAIDFSETSVEKPAKLNQWVKFTRYNGFSKKYETVYVRVVKSGNRTDDKKYVDDAIALNNSVCGDYGQIKEDELKVPSDSELCVMDYEVYVPDTFSADKYGIIAPDMDLSASNKKKGGFQSADGTLTYIGMGSITEIKTTKDSIDYDKGNTYSFRGLYIMVKGYNDYNFAVESYKEGTTSANADAEIKAYFARK